MLLLIISVVPSLLGDDHLGLVPVELEPQRAVAEVDLRLAGHQAGLRGELVEGGALVRVSVLLSVRVAGGRVSLRGGGAQQAAVRSVGDDGVVRHVAARTPDGEGGVRGSVLAGVGEHGAGSGGDGVRRSGQRGGGRRRTPCCCRSIESMTRVRESLQSRSGCAPPDVP